MAGRARRRRVRGVTTGRLILLGAVVAVVVAVLVFWHYLIVLAGGFVGWRLLKRQRRALLREERIER